MIENDIVEPKKAIWYLSTLIMLCTSSIVLIIKIIHTVKNEVLSQLPFELFLSNIIPKFIATNNAADIANTRYV